MHTPSILTLLAVGLAARVALLAWAEWQDAVSPVKYTDIDYAVFTDGAAAVAAGGSPYDRATYRYTPLLAWLHAPGASFAEAAAAGIEIGVSRMDQLVAAADAATAGRPTAVHLKLETGLGRNGIAPADYRVVFAEAARLERIGRVRVVGRDHLGEIDDDDLELVRDEGVELVEIAVDEAVLGELHQKFWSNPGWFAGGDGNT